jgi:2-methylfumaryl-CoA isomerase
MFAPLHQPRVGEYLAAGLPASIDGAHPPAVAAPALGADTELVLAARLGMSTDEIDRLRQSGAVATD